jgi:hypothetical protein
MIRRDPRQCWRCVGKTRTGSSCDFMHLMHARLMNGKMALKIGIYVAGLG